MFVATLFAPRARGDVADTNGAMSTTHGNANRPATATGDTWAEIVDHVDNYRSEVLSDSQHDRFGPRMRELVLAAQPLSRVDARAMLGSLALMLADTDLGDCTVDESLSDANVAAWSNRVSSKRSSMRTMTNHVGRIARLQRVLRGLPGRIRKYGSGRLRPAGFSDEELLELVGAACGRGEHAARGFAVALGLGRLDVVSGTFTNEQGQWWLVQQNGSRQWVLGIVGEVAGSLGDCRVRDGDVAAFRAAASAAGIHVDVAKSRQTFRSLALDIAIPARQLLDGFALSFSAIESVLVHLGAVDVTAADVQAQLRGPKVAACALATTAHAATRPPSSGGSRERRMAKSRKVSYAAVQRLAAQIREQATQPTSLPDNLQQLVDTYEPIDLTTATWSAIRPVFLDVITRGQIRGIESFKKHRVVIAGFLAWLYEQHRPLDTSSTFTYQTIDAYYIDGLTGMEDSTRNDYRSRLKNLARKLNPGLESPIPASGGHVSVRAGYSTAEEAAIQRVALRQRRDEVRRRVCIIVGLAGGGGLDAIDIKHQHTSGIIDQGDDGIIVHIAGPKARTVVIRRSYEDLVRAGLEGLRASELVLRNSGRNTTNPVGLALDKAESFDDTPNIDVSRLRSTWLSWLMCEPVPLRIVLQVAGLKSARTLADLLPHLPASENDLGWLRDGSLT